MKKKITHLPTYKTCNSVSFMTFSCAIISSWFTVCIIRWCWSWIHTSTNTWKIWSLNKFMSQLLPFWFLSLPTIFSTQNRNTCQNRLTHPKSTHTHLPRKRESPPSNLGLPDIKHFNSFLFFSLKDMIQIEIGKKKSIIDTFDSYVSCFALRASLIACSYLVLIARSTSYTGGS